MVSHRRFCGKFEGEKGTGEEMWIKEGEESGEPEPEGVGKANADAEEESWSHTLAGALEMSKAHFFISSEIDRGPEKLSGLTKFRNG